MMTDAEIDELVRHKVELVKRGKSMDDFDAMRLILGQIEMEISLAQSVKFFLLKALADSGAAAGPYMNSLYRVVAKQPTRPPSFEEAVEE